MLICAILAVSSAIESNGITDHMNTVACICDLTKYSCDNYCCCDTDCISALTTSWTSLGQCLSDEFTSYGLVFCSKTGTDFKDSSKSNIIDPLFKFLCVQYNNAPDWGTYNVLILDNYSVDTISNLISDVVQYPDNLVSTAYDAGHTAFLPADRMRASLNGWGVFDGTWVLPSPDPSGQCIYTNAVMWLIPTSPQSCTVTLDPSQPLLSLVTVADFQSSLKVSGDATYFATTASSVGITTGTVTFRTATSTSLLTSAPTTTCTACACTKTLVQADYLIYTNADQQSIEKIVLNLVVEDTSSCNVMQSFSATFYTSNSAWKSSGNPGYIKGKQLITAVQGTSFNIQGAMKLYGGSDSGSCGSGNYPNAPTVLYGQDLVFSCYLSENLVGLESLCTGSIESQNIFASNTVTHIAKFGNINTTNIDDWVAINYTAPSGGTWNSVDNTCNLPAILVYDIFYTSVGPYQNPQDKIIYVTKYYQNTTWVYRYSDTSKSQNFVLSVVVNYIPYQTGDDPYLLSIDKRSIVAGDVVYAVQNSFGRITLGGILLLILIIFI